MIEPHADKPATGRLHRFAHRAMACVFEALVYYDEARYARHAARAAFEEIDRLEQLLSRFVPHSDISRIAALERGRPLPISGETIECLRLASEVHAATEGAFDIAFRTPGSRPRDLPLLMLDPVNHAVSVRVPGVSLDLGGLGKGYAVDRMAEIMRDWGIEAALLHAGQSTVYALGSHPDAGGWRVGLRPPDQSGNVFGQVTLRGCALSGSGRLLHGRHIHDPHSGEPAKEAEAAWALAESAALADALSTAFMVLTPTEVERVCERLPGVAAMLLGTRDGTAEVLRLGDWAAFDSPLKNCGAGPSSSARPR